MKKLWIPLIILLLPLGAFANPEGFSLSLGAAASKAYSDVPLIPDGGFGLTGTLEYGFSDWFSAGLGVGMTEYLAPTGQTDMKSAWADFIGRFFFLPDSSLGQPYWQVGFGFSPYITGLFEDYWPDYASAQFGKPRSDLYWTAQTSLGYRFHFSSDWALDMGAQYSIFWPPVDLPLQSLDLEARAVWFLAGPKAPGPVK